MLYLDRIPILSRKGILRLLLETLLTLGESLVPGQQSASPCMSKVSQAEAASKYNFCEVEELGAR
jgi:hypothetical protein